MKMLHSAEEIRNAVMEVLGDVNSERYAFVAFVGSDPLRWLPHPQGLQVFCWPRAGGTNPEGVDALVNAGVKVHFKESLHSKVYHSDRRGTVIGSANLSNNALGSGRLTETAVKIPPGIFSVADQLKLLNDVTTSGSPEFHVMMEKLRREHVDYYQRNPDLLDSGGNGKTMLTFGQWSELDESSRSPWQLGIWAAEYGPPEDIIEELRETGVTHFSNWRAHSNKKNISVYVATLDCQYRTDQWGVIKKGTHWWYPEAQRTTKSTDWKESPYVWIARVNVPQAVAVPFDCRERRFLEALDRAVAKFADKIESLEGPVKGEFLESLTEEYRIGGTGLSKAAMRDIFELSQQVTKREITLRKATDELVERYGLNRSSAQSTIRSIRHIFNGEAYHRILTIPMVEYVMERISKDFGPSELRKAIEALSTHIKYLNSLPSKNKAPGLVSILKRFSK